MSCSWSTRLERTKHVNVTSRFIMASFNIHCNRLLAFCADTAHLHTYVHIKQVQNSHLTQQNAFYTYTVPRSCCLIIWYCTNVPAIIYYTLLINHISDVVIESRWLELAMWKEYPGFQYEYRTAFITFTISEICNNFFFQFSLLLFCLLKYKYTLLPATR